MHPVAVTLPRVAALSRSMLSHAFSKPSQIAWFAALTALLLTRTASYAAGVIAMGNVFTECKNARTVRELHAHLLYRALSMLTMKQAISNFLMEANCTRLGEDRFMSSNLPQGKPGSTTDGEY